MAIEDAVKAYCATGRLHRLPSFGDPERRFLCVSENLHNLINGIGPLVDDALERLGAHVLASLMAVAQKPRLAVRIGNPKDDSAQVAVFGRHSIAEIRCLPTRTAASVRVFCCIPATDVVVALGWELRCKLGGYRDPRWKRAFDACHAEWQALFPFDSPLLTGSNPHDYLTGAYPS